MAEEERLVIQLQSSFRRTKLESDGNPKRNERQSEKENKTKDSKREKKRRRRNVDV